MRARGFGRRWQAGMLCFFVFVGSRTLFACQRLDGGAHSFDGLFDMYFVLKVVVLYSQQSNSTKKSANWCVYALKGVTYLFGLACHETVVFAIDVKIVLRHDSRADFRARASKHLFCTRRERTEMTGLVEYRHAHDDRQQAQKGHHRTTTAKGEELSAYTEDKKEGAVRCRISDTGGWKGFLT